MIGATVLTGCVAAPPAVDSEQQSRADEVGPVIRIDQVGFGLGETKSGYVMGSSDDLDGAGFRVVDAGGAVVLSGDLGSETGPWNDAFDAVRVIDLTEVDATGRYVVELTGSDADAEAPFAVAPIADLLTPLADLTVPFFQAQRDGSDVIPTVLDRKPSHLLDRTATVFVPPTYADDGATLVDDRLTPAGLYPVDVSGGWFDAGDFLKFTGTTAYASAMMLLALRTQSEPDPALDAEADFGLQWLEKMWDADTETLFLQVGLGNGNDSIRTDHDVWRLPEDDDGSEAQPGDPDYTISHRPVFAANEPGQPLPPSVAGRLAAAFALDAQRAGEEGDLARAHDRLDASATIYAQANTAPVDPAARATAIPAEFYPEDSWQDDLEFAAVELATAGILLDDPRAASWQTDAATWAEAYLESDAVGTLGVADVSALAHADLLALDDPAAAALLDDLRRQLDAGVEHAASDPFGAGASTLDFDAVPFTFGLMATAALYENASGDDSYRAFATAQRGWALGANAWGTTFMIGAGTTYPRCPEHQVANLTDADEELRGAVVNGPNATEKLDDLNRFDTMRRCEADAADGVPYRVFDGQGSRYLDDVGAWQTVEPSLDFTSTALLALALRAAQGD